jgi:hypothetical protein
MRLAPDRFVIVKRVSRTHTRDAKRSIR